MRGGTKQVRAVGHRPTLSDCPSGEAWASLQVSVRSGTKDRVLRRSGRIRTPNDTESAPGTGSGQRTKLDVGSRGHAGGDSQPGRATQPAGHHLHQRVQAGGGEPILAFAVAGQQAAHGERLIAPAVAILQQKQPFSGERGGQDRVLRRQPVPPRQGHEKRIPRNWRSIGVAAVTRQCQQQHVEPDSRQGARPDGQWCPRADTAAAAESRDAAPASAVAAGTAKPSGSRPVEAGRSSASGRHARLRPPPPTPSTPRRPVPPVPARVA